MTPRQEPPASPFETARIASKVIKLGLRIQRARRGR